MKLTHVLALFTLSVIVQGNLIAAVARPVVLSLGSIFTAMKTQDALSEMHIEWRDLLPFSKKSTPAKFANKVEEKLDDDMMKIFEKPRDKIARPDFRKA